MSDVGCGVGFILCSRTMNHETILESSMDRTPKSERHRWSVRRKMHKLLGGGNIRLHSPVGGGGLLSSGSHPCDYRCIPRRRGCCKASISSTRLRLLWTIERSKYAPPQSERTRKSTPAVYLCLVPVFDSSAQGR